MSQENQKNFLLDLPYVVQTRVVFYLDAKSALSLGQTCTTFQDIVSLPTMFWRLLMIAYFWDMSMDIQEQWLFNSVYEKCPQPAEPYRGVTCTLNTPCPLGVSAGNARTTQEFLSFIRMTSEDIQGKLMLIMMNFINEKYGNITRSSECEKCNGKIPE